MLGNIAILATEAGGTTVATGLDSMLSMMQTVLTFSMTIFEKVVGNPIMSFIVAGSLVGIGVNVLRQVKGAASA